MSNSPFASPRPNRCLARDLSSSWRKGADLSSGSHQMASTLSDLSATTSASPECTTVTLPLTVYQLNAVIISVDYAKSPRYPYPHALLQMYETIIWATSPQATETLESAIDPSRVAVMGNSAGGNLAASLTMLLSFTSGHCAPFRKRLSESFNIKAQVLLYPSLACNRPYLDRYNAADDETRASSLPVWAATLMEASYLPPHVNKDQIFVAPVNAGVELIASLYLPPAICITAGKDCLKLEAEEYTRKLRQAGVEVASYEYPDAVHGFSHHKCDFAVERESCWTRVSRFLKEHLEV